LADSLNEEQKGIFILARWSARSAERRGHSRLSEQGRRRGPLVRIPSRVCFWQINLV